MSHFDKALAAREGSPAGEAAPVVAEPSTAGRLSDYRREDAVAQGDRAEPRRQPPAPATAPVPLRVESRARAPLAGDEAWPRALPVDAKLAARLVSSNGNSLSLEQYRRLAAALHDTQGQQGLKTVMVTSSMPDEGKTLTVANLALTLSASYERRVLVIDADLRSPSIHAALGVANTRGLSEALRDERFELPIVEVSPRLSVMTAGRPGDAALAGLTSERMKAVIAECSGRFDWVILDTPPVGVLPDAQLLSRLTGGVIFVIAAGATPSATVDRAIAELGQECILGTVLNRVQEHQIPGADYYHRYRANENGSSGSS